MEDGVAYIHLQMVVSSQVSQDTPMTTPTKHVEPHPRGNGSYVLSRSVLKTRGQQTPITESLKRPHLGRRGATHDAGQHSDHVDGDGICVLVQHLGVEGKSEEAAARTWQ